VGRILAAAPSGNCAPTRWHHCPLFAPDCLHCARFQPQNRAQMRRPSSRLLRQSSAVFPPLLARRARAPQRHLDRNGRRLVRRLGARAPLSAEQSPLGGCGREDPPGLLLVQLSLRQRSIWSASVAASKRLAQTQARPQGLVLQGQWASLGQIATFWRGRNSLIESLIHSRGPLIISMSNVATWRAALWRVGGSLNEDTCSNGPTWTR